MDERRISNSRISVEIIKVTMEENTVDLGIGKEIPVESEGENDNSDDYSGKNDTDDFFIDGIRNSICIQRL